MRTRQGRPCLWGHHRNDLTFTLQPPATVINVRVGPVVPDAKTIAKQIARITRRGWR